MRDFRVTENDGLDSVRGKSVHTSPLVSSRPAEQSDAALCRESNQLISWTLGGPC
jgi:hypothetical protein